MDITIGRVHHIEFLLIGRQGDTVTWSTRSPTIPGESLNTHCIEYLTRFNITNLETKQTSGGSIRDRFRTVNSKGSDAAKERTNILDYLVSSCISNLKIVVIPTAQVYVSAI